MHDRYHARQIEDWARLAVLLAIIITLVLVVGLAIVLLPAPPEPSPIVTPVPR